MADTLLGKYRLFEVIGEGGFGHVRRAEVIETGQPIAIKFVRFAADNVLSLFTESETLSQLQGCEGFPKLYAYGKQTHFEFMVTELLGKSLMQRFHDCHKKFTPETVAKVAIQVIERLEFMHSRGYLHRDIKPQNLLTGIDSEATIYVTDFGLAKKYINEFFIHIPYKTDVNIAGTLYFASNNTHRGIQSSRRDDLETLLHVLIYFLKGALPWAKSSRANAEAVKLTVTPMELCTGLPNCILQSLVYIRSLQFEEKPNYSYLKQLFSAATEGSECKFDWEILGFVRAKARANSVGQALLRPPRSSTRRRSGKLTSVTEYPSTSEAIMVGNAIRRTAVGQRLTQPSSKQSDDEFESEEDTLKLQKFPVFPRKSS